MPLPLTVFCSSKIQIGFTFLVPAHLGSPGKRPLNGWVLLASEWWGVGVVICLERGADLHTVQLMPLPLIVSCFSKIQTGFTFLVPAHPGSPGKRAVKRVSYLTIYQQYSEQISHCNRQDRQAELTTALRSICAFKSIYWHITNKSVLSLVPRLSTWRYPQLGRLQLLTDSRYAAPAAGVSATRHLGEMR